MSLRAACPPAGLPEPACLSLAGWAVAGHACGCPAAARAGAVPRPASARGPHLNPSWAVSAGPELACLSQPVSGKTRSRRRLLLPSRASLDGTGWLAGRPAGWLVRLPACTLPGCCGAAVAPALSAPWSPPSQLGALVITTACLRICLVAVARGHDAAHLRLHCVASPRAVCSRPGRRGAERSVSALAARPPACPALRPAFLCPPPFIFPCTLPYPPTHTHREEQPSPCSLCNLSPAFSAC